SALITACLDTQYGNTATKENYIDYIANRPRVEKLGEHGLFAQTDAPLDLDEIAHEVAHQGNNVWTDIISLRREDAAATGFDNAAAWRDLLRSKAETIARNYKIPMRDFVWYAAFHDEGHHPHVHFVCYSEGKDVLCVAVTAYIHHSDYPIPRTAGRKIWARGGKDYCG
ncbi:MobP3 family relaxase, partial [Parabacteroides goldsteinii]|uniref:MobP3 family relaxase n=1 Tax=Parabacteroides goldsteinii TaxID=328812 RepID=UPI00259AEE19